MAKTKILLEIDCDEKTCGKCQYKLSHSTGLVGEFHPICDVFDGHYGEWGARDMKRARRCIAAQKKASNVENHRTEASAACRRSGGLEC